jgi:hypothetical protein
MIKRHVFAAASALLIAALVMSACGFREDIPLPDETPQVSYPA